jgi:hypothetical protein
MRRRTITTIVTVLLLAGGIVAAAQVAADRAQASSDRRAATSASERSHDLRDVATLQSIRTRFDAARKGKDTAALRVVRGEFRTLAMKEKAEGRGQVSSGGTDARPGAASPEGTRREIATASMAEPSPASASSRGEPSAGQDRDAAVAAKILMRRQEIVMDLRNLGGGTNAATLDHERALMDELILLAKAEASPARREPGKKGGSTEETRGKP